MDIREQTCCFTGHRQLPPQELPAIQKRLEEAVSALVERGVRYFCAGGALGFDTLAARVVLDLRAVHPQIQLILVLPCEDQTRGWSAADAAEYERIRSAADKVLCLAEGYYRGCMHARNRRLVEESAHCVCYLVKPGGGTAYTVRCARAQGLSILNIASS